MGVTRRGRNDTNGVSRDRIRMTPMAVKFDTPQVPVVCSHLTPHNSGTITSHCATTSSTTLHHLLYKHEQNIIARLYNNTIGSRVN